MDDLLLSKFLSGHASEADIARLRAAVDADPAAVDELFEAAELERDLAEVVRAGALRSRRRSWISAAAALLLALAGAFLLLGRGTPAEIARLKGVDGGVFRLGAAGRTVLVAGDALREGEGVETDGRGRAALRFEDGTLVELEADSVARKFAATSGKTFALERGALAADVVRQPSGLAMSIRTPQGEARVLGTRFRLAAQGGATRLDVHHGVVRLTRSSDGTSADIGAGQIGTAGPGPAPVARPSAAAVARMAPGSWTAVPGSAMAAVAPDPLKFGATRGNMGPAGVMAAWSGGAFDVRRGRLVVWGGGYSDYAGNELYAFELASMVWRRLTDPTARPRLNQEENDDGTPASRATYNGLAYLEHADRFFALGGARAGNGFGCRIPWAFDFVAKTWSRKSPAGPAPAGSLGAACSYDSATRKLWWGDGSGIYSLDVDADRWTQHGDDAFYYLTGAIDTRRGLWVLAGEGKVLAYDIRGGTPLRQVWSTRGGDAVLSRSNPGLDYDRVRDRITAWAGGAVYALDPETKTWTATEAPGAPAPTANGIYGRWRYAAAVDAFIVVTAVDGNVHFYKPAK